MHRYFIYCEVPNSLSPNHGRDPATIERVGGVKEKMFEISCSTRTASLQGRLDFDSAIGECLGYRAGAFRVLMGAD